MRLTQRAVVLVHHDARHDPQRHGVPERLVDARQIHETCGPAHGKVDIAHRDEWHADKEPDPLGFRLHEHLNNDVGWKIMCREPGWPHDQCRGETHESTRDAAAYGLAWWPPQLLEPVQHDANFSDGSIRLDGLNTKEPAAVFRHRIGRRRRDAPSELSLEEASRRGRDQCGSLRDSDGHHRVALKIEQLPAVGGPHGLGATVGRNRMARARARKRLDVDLGRPDSLDW